MRFNKLLDEQEIHTLQRQTEVVAQAADYLSTTEQGSTIKAPNLDQEVKISWKQRTVWLCATHVFASTGWVRRMAAVRELMLMYIMGGPEIEAVSECALRRNITFSEFTQQVPVRVLSHLLEILGNKNKMNESVLLSMQPRQEESCTEASGVTCGLAKVGRFRDMEWEKKLVMEYLRHGC